MRIYLAGGISGNLQAKWKSIIGGGQNEDLFSGQVFRKEYPNGTYRGGQHYILESFFYARTNPWMEQIIPRLDDFILDSGAFTAIRGNAGNIDWGRYVEEYADFINRNKIDKFFELDIDTLIGLREVERLRTRLENLTGKQPIPVWHKDRGLQKFREICKEYQYIALGGIAIKEIPIKKFEKTFDYFINTAHEAGAKIHGLGYTNIAGLHKYHFDSVDSTAWLYGNRGGYLYRFNEITGLM